MAEAAHAAGLLVHLDGARIANALVATGTDLATMVRDTGVDVMTLGLTKDGAMYGETVVFLRPELADRAAFVRKQAGQLSSKARFIAAQVVALLDDDLWLRNAAHANAMAGELADRRGRHPRRGHRAPAGGELGVRHRARLGHRAAPGSGRSSGSGTSPSRSSAG